MSECYLLKGIFLKTLDNFKLKILEKIAKRINL